MKQNEITMSEQEMVEFVNMYNNIVPKNQTKKFNGLELNEDGDTEDDGVLTSEQLP